MGRRNLARLFLVLFTLVGLVISGASYAYERTYSHFTVTRLPSGTVNMGDRVTLIVTHNDITYPPYDGKYGKLGWRVFDRYPSATSTDGSVANGVSTTTTGRHTVTFTLKKSGSYYVRLYCDKTDFCQIYGPISVKDSNTSSLSGSTGTSTSSQKPTASFKLTGFNKSGSYYVIEKGKYFTFTDTSTPSGKIDYKILYLARSDDFDLSMKKFGEARGTSSCKSFSGTYKMDASEGTYTLVFSAQIGSSKNMSTKTEKIKVVAPASQSNQNTGTSSSSGNSTGTTSNQPKPQAYFDVSGFKNEHPYLVIEKGKKFNFTDKSTPTDKIDWKALTLRKGNDAEEVIKDFIVKEGTSAHARISRSYVMDAEPGTYSLLFAVKIGSWSNMGKAMCAVKVVALANNSSSNTNDTAKEDKTKPEITVDPGTENKTVKIDAGYRVKLTVEDESGLSELKYYWDSSKNAEEIETGGSNKVTKTIAVPEDFEGKHTLYVVAVDASDRENKDTVRFYYQVENEEIVKEEEEVVEEKEDDRTDPTIVADPGKENKTVEIEAGDRVKLTVEDESGLSELKYYWDSSKNAKEVQPAGSKKVTKTIEVPEDFEGRHTLYVIAADASDRENKDTVRFYYQVKNEEVAKKKNDKTDPKVVAEPGTENKTVEIDAGGMIKLTVEDESGLSELKYYWNSSKNAKEVQPAGSKKVTKTIAVPEDFEGKHTFYVVAADASDRKNKDTVRFYYQVKNEEVAKKKNDKTDPTVKAEPGEENKRIEIRAGAMINIIAEDENGISELKYYWDSSKNAKEIQTYESNKVEEAIMVPKDFEGRHTLYVVAADASDRKNKDTLRFYYEISEEGEPEKNDLKITVAAASTVSEFKDVGDKYKWALDAINGMAQRGIIAGYEDGTFRPEGKITRAEFAKIMVKTLNIKETLPSVQTFADVGKDHWAYRVVETSKSYLTGYINTATGQKFYKPSEEALREDIAVALVKAMGYSIDGITREDVRDAFKDAGSISSDEIGRYILAAKNNGLISGYEDGTFRPQGKLTRAEAATLLWRVVQKNENENIKKVVIE